MYTNNCNSYNLNPYGGLEFLSTKQNNYWHTSLFLPAVHLQRILVLGLIPVDLCLQYGFQSISLFTSLQARDSSSHVLQMRWLKFRKLYTWSNWVIKREFEFRAIQSSWKKHSIRGTQYFGVSGPPGRRIVLGHTLNTSRHIITKNLIMF